MSRLQQLNLNNRGYEERADDLQELRLYSRGEDYRHGQGVEGDGRLGVEQPFAGGECVQPVPRQRAAGHDNSGRGEQLHFEQDADEELLPDAGPLADQQLQPDPGLLRPQQVQQVHSGQGEVRVQDGGAEEDPQGEELGGHRGCLHLHCLPGRRVPAHLQGDLHPGQHPQEGGGQGVQAHLPAHRPRKGGLHQGHRLQVLLRPQCKHQAPELRHRNCA